MQIRKEIWLLILTVLISTVAIWVRLDMQTIYSNYDGPYYIAVAKTWYNKEALGKNFDFSLPLEYYPAHFPLYPLLISWIAKLGPTYPQAMVAVNVLATIAGAVIIYLAAETLKWKSGFWLALAWLFWWPRMWAVRSVGSPETLFIALTAGSLLLFKKRSFLLAAVLGSLAILTKSPGVLLLLTYFIFQIVQFLKTRKWEMRIWPVLIIMGMTLVGLFGFYYLRTGDFWAYFHTGDNIHLQTLPFRVFDSTQAWVGSFWLEDVVWIYLLAGLGVYYALRKDLVWGMFGLVFYTSLLFVSHRDISRYSLPLVPVVLLGFSEMFAKKEIRILLIASIIPLFLYTINFVSNNTLSIANWGPLL